MSKRTRARLWLVLILLYLVGIFILCYDLVDFSSRDKVHPINFARITNGMTKAEVEGLLGTERFQGSGSFEGAMIGNHWMGDRFSIEITFDEKDVVRGKRIAAYMTPQRFLDRVYVFLLCYG